MRSTSGVAAISLGLLLLVPTARLEHTAPQVEALVAPPRQPASMTIPAPEAPVVVPGNASLNTRGWAAGSPAVLGPAGYVSDEVLAAYSTAVAASPADCHLSVSLLEAIGQVESGNLAGRELDEGHRVVPAILGPVLDGTEGPAVRDTDAGHWDGNNQWDRAMGPLQLLPASWRVVSVDLDGDGVRDPQNIYDAAGGAMVYLCAGGRDLGSEAGLRAAVLSYNHSEAYLELVLAWKAAYERADLTTADLSLFDAWALPAIESSTPLLASLGARAASDVLGTPPAPQPPVFPGDQPGAQPVLPTGLPTGLQPGSETSGQADAQPDAALPSAGAPSAGAPSAGAPSAGAPSAGAPSAPASSDGPATKATEPAASTGPAPAPDPAPTPAPGGGSSSSPDPAPAPAQPPAPAADPSTGPTSGPTPGPVTLPVCPDPVLITDPSVAPADLGLPDGPVLCVPATPTESAAATAP